ncbi:glycoside hydrolase family 4 [Caldicellulosiruptor obsidiansis OB47]|uniref:Glycoside hydrolase family 4 n=1 Tax=Caldicellulosiruptor obsidiansis (strain ATCC BAA-2073 / JCM 16842 / OB47) TaxID=608506 RepID=D9TFV3_CALOO|nr:alpha-glucosidase/alpha-galactosidase [Caldicellulosiruptor obsidiansis]ADL43073.1 glycoside hydrolase family 4 [Caldicellulosiruptor obsidiansis OB47]
MLNTTSEQQKQINIAYIGGGSRGWAWRLMTDLALEKDLSGTVRLYDIDFEAAKTNEVIGNKLSSKPEIVGKWKYVAVESLDEALYGADFIIISILPGTFEEMYSDVHAPEKYGIYQSVGDTTGPGGLIRGLRTVPMYVEFAEAIKRNCPDAWVINYTNPMAICLKALYEVFPKIKAFGCCHEVFGTQKLLTEVVKEFLGEEREISRREIKVNVLGINHFTWFDKASYKTHDLFPLYKEFVHKYYEEGFEKTKGLWEKDYFASANRVKFDLFKRFGLIAAAGDRHLAEFVPYIYLRDKETVYKWKFNLTPVEWRIKHREELIKLSKEYASDQKEVPLNPSGEEGVMQMKAILGLDTLVTNVNLPNMGQIPNLPIGAIVETNAVFTHDDVRPVYAGKLPSDLASIMTRHISNQELIVKAALEKDLNLAKRAFLNDPAVERLPQNKAEQLFDEMINNTKKYLAYLGL